MQSDYSSLKLFLNSLKNADEELILAALTHPSFAAENGLSHNDTYERLEFLGDAVLKLLASAFLLKKFPEYKEGELSNIRSFIVSDETLAKIAGEIGLTELIRVAQNDKTLNKYESVAACAFEAILGALFLSGEVEKLKEFFEFNFSKVVDDVDKNIIIYNPKALLQEYTQKETKELPVYEIISEKGAAHEKQFEVQVKYTGEILAKGCGKTKKAAQQEAALNACEKLNLLIKASI